MEISINVNETVKVKMTDLGWQIYLNEMNQLSFFRKKNHTIETLRANKEDENGYSSWQLWELMNFFGTHMYCGAQLPFSNDILIKKE